MWSLQALKLGCLLALATLPLLCGLLPALLFRLRGAAANGTSRSGRSILSCVAAGVFMAACLLDVVPDSLADLRVELRRQSLWPAFPAPELVLALGFLLVLVLEHAMLDCSERPGAEATPPLVRRQEAAVGEQRAEAALSPFRSLVRVVSLSLHSAFEGLALGLQDTPSQVLRLATAIVLHKCIIAASLGLWLLQSRLALPWLAAALACFSLMSPVGVGVGMAVPWGANGSLARSILEGVAAGTFLYITFLEILPQELHPPWAACPKSWLCSWASPEWPDCASWAELRLPPLDVDSFLGHRSSGTFSGFIKYVCICPEQRPLWRQFVLFLPHFMILAGGGGACCCNLASLYNLLEAHLST